MNDERYNVVVHLDEVPVYFISSRTHSWNELNGYRTVASDLGEDEARALRDLLNYGEQHE